MIYTTLFSNLKKAKFILLVVFFISAYSFSQVSSNSFSQNGQSINRINNLGTSTPTDFNSGAAVIDMGITPQTDNNALKPYGLVYTLVEAGIPVHWVIKDGKSFVDASNKEDHTDLEVVGTTTRLGNTSTGLKELKAGPFLIPAEFIDDAYTILEDWIDDYDGLTVYWNINDSYLQDVPVRGIITTFPNTVIYPKNGNINSNNDTDIEIGFYNRAGIPESSGIFRKGVPDDITECDQFYVLSHHSDPELNWDQDDVNIIFDFVESGKNVFLGCHDVSISENLTTSGGRAKDSLNFLSTTGLMPYGDTGDHPPIYEFVGPIHNKNFKSANVLYELAGTTASDPIMQFMGEIHDALDGNSEHVYLPRLGGAWRGTTTAGFYDPSHVDIPGNSPGKAAIMAYGKAYGLSNYGSVLYTGSHISSKNKGGNPEWVGEARLFGNFLLQSALELAPEITIPDLPNPPITVCSGEDLFLTALLNNVPAGDPSYLWEAEVVSGPGDPIIFTPNNTSLSTTLNFPVVSAQTVYKITFTLTIIPPGNCSNPIIAKYITSITLEPAPDAPTLDAEIAECDEGQTLDANDAVTIPPAPFNNLLSGDSPILTEVEQNTFTVEDQNNTLLASCTPEIIWYDAAVGGNPVANPTQTGVGSSTYWAETVGANCCVSLTRTQVILTLYDCAIDIEKEASPNDTQNCNAIAPGETIDYTFTVTNLGNVDISSIVVTDALLEAPNPVVAISGPTGDTGNDGVLGLIEVWIYTASYTVTQADIVNGQVDNTAEDSNSLRLCH